MCQNKRWKLQWYTCTVWRVRGKIIRSVLCSIVRIIHSELHTDMNRTNSSLDWVLSQWVDFTLLLRFIFVIYYFVSDCILHACVVL